MVGPSIDWGPWTAARFPSHESRDAFIRSVAATGDDAREATPVADDGCGAWVRWRPGHFLSLNDMAYAQRGRIIVTAVPRLER